MNYTFDEASRLLQVPDAVMQPEVIGVLRGFLQLGGSPDDAIRMLSTSYQGYAQMCNLMATWLQMTGVSTRDIQDKNESLMEHLVLQRFNGRKADSIIQRASEAPKWVSTLINEKKWRQLIYRLVAEYKDCELLNYTIQLISDSGYQDEICGLPAASVYFNVFVRVLTYLLERMIRLPNTADHVKELPTIIAMCTLNQQTFVLSQSILQCLILEQRGENLSWLSQEIYESVKERPLATQLENLISRNYAQYSEDLQSAISSIVRSGEASQGDVVKLFDLYVSDNPPPASFIQRVDVLDLLIMEVLKNLATSSDRQLHSYIYLLAYASVKNNESNQISEEEKFLLDKIIQLTKSTFISKVRENLIGKELQSFLVELYDLVQFPILSSLILKWVNLTLISADFYSSNTNVRMFDWYLDLLNEITLQQPLHRGQIFTLLLNLFFLETELDPITAAEKKKNILDCIVYLIECGYSLPVMNTVSQWAANGVDLSLIRYFSVKLLNMIEPPYSDEFLQPMVAIILSVGTSSLDLEDYRQALDQFIAYCTISVEHGVLSPEETEFVERVHKMLRSGQFNRLIVKLGT